MMKANEYLKGSVTIAVKGFSRGRFINLLASAGIPAHDINDCGSELRLRLSADDLRRIKPLLKRSGCRFCCTHIAAEDFLRQVLSFFLPCLFLCHSLSGL